MLGVLGHLAMAPGTQRWDIGDTQPGVLVTAGGAGDTVLGARDSELRVMGTGLGAGYTQPGDMGHNAKMVGGKCQHTGDTQECWGTVLRCWSQPGVLGTQC